MIGQSVGLFVRPYICLFCLSLSSRHLHAAHPITPGPINHKHSPPPTPLPSYPQMNQQTAAGSFGAFVYESVENDVDGSVG